MRLPFLNKKKDDTGYYLALILDEEKTSSVILEEAGGILKIVGKHTEHFTSKIETIPQEDLIKIVDRTISKAEEILPPNIETHKTIFGVKENWVEKDTKKIKKEYLSKLKKVCDSLDLSPIGFMVINEAIATLLQHEEGSPLSAILIDTGKKTIHLTLFRGGKVIEESSGPIEHNVPATVDSLLKSFTVSVLPTKILLLHSMEAKELAQHFINHEWSKGLPFLHTPQVSILPKDYDARAVTYGASQQMGFEIQNSMESIPQFENEIEKKTAELKDQEDVTDIIPEPTLNTGNFGFLVNQDIAKTPSTITDAKKDNEMREFTNKKNANLDKLDEEIDTPSLHSPDPESTQATNVGYEESKKSGRAKIFAGIKPLFGLIKLPKIIGFSNFFSKNKNLKIPLLIICAILTLGIVLSLFYFYSVNAQVILSVKPKLVTQDENVTFSTTSANDFSKNIIAAKSISTSIDGELSATATGKKDAGDKAKGSVTIYNSDNNPVTLSSGTEIKSSNGITFITDKEIKMASASGDIFTGTKPGTATVTVVAKDIGTESNLPSNTKFTVGGNSNLAAKNDNAFSGGTKKAITVVSKTDIAKLRSDLPKKLETDAVKKLSDNQDPNTNVLPGFLKVSIADEDFDKDVDDEAKQVKLKATIKFDSMSYQNEDLENFDKSILKAHFTQDISFAKNSLKNEIKDIDKKNDDELTAKIKITAGLLPKINNGEVIDKLKNKSAKEAKDILDTIPQVSKSEIKYSPNIPFLSNLFPRLPKNINVLVNSNE